jgi:hypothetical protein
MQWGIKSLSIGFSHGIIAESNANCGRWHDRQEIVVWQSFSSKKTTNIAPFDLTFKTNSTRLKSFILMLRVSKIGVSCRKFYVP